MCPLMKISLGYLDLGKLILCLTALKQAVYISIAFTCLVSFCPSFDNCPRGKPVTHSRTI